MKNHLTFQTFVITLPLDNQYKLISPISIDIFLAFDSAYIFWPFRAVHRKRRHHHSQEGRLQPPSVSNGPEGLSKAFKRASNFAGVAFKPAASAFAAKEASLHMLAKRESRRTEAGGLHGLDKKLPEKIQQLCHVLHGTEDSTDRNKLTRQVL